MTDALKLSASLRTGDSGRRASIALREQSLIPAVVYGKGIAPRTLTVQYNPFDQLFSKAGESSLIQLSVDSEAPINVLVHDFQRDPLTNRYSHVDFYQVNMNEKITTEVEIHFEGVSPAVKDLAGILVKNISSLEITCLPADLPHALVVDISALKTFADYIRVKDIVLPKGVTTERNLDDVIAGVSEPRSEEELSSLNQAVVEDVTKVVAEADVKKEEKEKEKAADDKDKK
ncbi:MAG: 50S ribosomal protein L25 [Candidatus Kerfeldbacteria bacterium]|nr:50S ribosomal protein L25 [Candidatus Kerfeldbacteria bacterium]